MLLENYEAQEAYENLPEQYKIQPFGLIMKYFSTRLE